MIEKLFSHNNVSPNQLLSKAAHGFIFISCLCLFFYAINKPFQNWDMLGYAASAISIENSNESEIHSFIFQEFKAYATAETFHDLTEADSYRRTMFSDATAFSQQTPYYKIRIVFILLILGLVKLGVNIFVASHIVTAFFTSAGLMVFYYAFRKWVYPPFWALIPLFFIDFNIVKIAQIVTADSLAFFWTGLVCYAFLNTKWTLFFLLLVISVLVRTDMIFLVALFSGYLFLFRPNLRLITLLSAVTTVFAYLLINKYAGNYGWSTVFYFVFVSDMMATHPVEYSSIGISIEQYLSAVKGRLKGFVFDHTVLLFEITTLFQFFILLSQIKKNTSFKNAVKNVFTNNPTIVLTVISVLYLIIHFILFPLLEYRFFAGQYLISALGLLAMISSLLGDKSSAE